MSASQQEGECVAPAGAKRRKLLAEAKLHQGGHKLSEAQLKCGGKQTSGERAGRKWRGEERKYHILLKFLTNNVKKKKTVQAAMFLSVSTRKHRPPVAGESVICWITLECCALWDTVLL